MKTLHTKKQQSEFLENNWALRTLEHKWSTSGYGSSRIFNDKGEQLTKVGGCGFDRFGSAIGKVIESVYYAEIYKLARKTCKNTVRKDYQPSNKFYGLFYDAVKDQAWLDGACGYECMIKILNAVGYDLKQVAKCDKTSNSGSVFYQLTEVPRYKVEWLKR